MSYVRISEGDVRERTQFSYFLEKAFSSRPAFEKDVETVEYISPFPKSHSLTFSPSFSLLRCSLGVVILSFATQHATFDSMTFVLDDTNVLRTRIRRTVDTT